MRPAGYTNGLVSCVAAKIDERFHVLTFRKDNIGMGKCVLVVCASV